MNAPELSGFTAEAGERSKSRGQRRPAKRGEVQEAKLR